MNTGLQLLRRVVVACFLAPVLAFAQAAATPPLKVLRLPFTVAETGFDYAQVYDLYSNTAMAHMFEALYEYDHLARPFKIKPATADGMPEVSPDFRTYTVRLKPGILFADDPAFKGRKRELVAADYVYSIKRYFDPAMKSPRYIEMLDEGIVGLDGLRQASLKTGKPFDYDREVEGLRALDRYTLQFKFEKPRPRFLYTLANLVAMAREVAELYGLAVSEHPVGTGPFRLVKWRRSSLMVFERNPNYREVYYDAEPNADDAEGQALVARFKGRRLPMVDRVEVSVVDESQPRWLAFLNGEFDVLDVTVPLEFTHSAVPHGKLAPNLAKRGIQLFRVVRPDVIFRFFNMDDPVVGGYTLEKVALRRALSLAMNVEQEITRVRRGQAIPAQSIIAPGTSAYDPDLKTVNSDFSPAQANALLDLNGFVDKDGDGWRDQPDGKPLVIRYATQPDPISREFDELWKRNLDRVNVRTRFETSPWPDQLKRTRAGQLMVWQLGTTATSPDSAGFLSLGFGPSVGGSNYARFRLGAFDDLYRQVDALPDGPERSAAIREAARLLTVYAPYKFSVHRINNQVAHPWVIGYRPTVFWHQYWHRVDIDLSQRP